MKRKPTWAQTGQLYNEAAAAAVGKTYCFGPTFRAEKSKTRRHLTEFWMIEPEVAFAHLEDIMVLAEGLITFLVGRVVERRSAELATLKRDPDKLQAITAPFPRITYDEAIRILKERGSKIEWGSDLGATDETLLSEAYDKPVMVHRYPAGMKAFYMQPDAEQPDRALCVDVLAPEGYGEIVGGSERISDLALLERRLEEQRLPLETFRWYLDLRRYGTCPHSGFGMGIERVVAWICGLDHVRESIPFPANALHPVSLAEIRGREQKARAAKSGRSPFVQITSKAGKVIFSAAAIAVFLWIVVWTTKSVVAHYLARKPELSRLELAARLVPGDANYQRFLGRYLPLYPRRNGLRQVGGVLPPGGGTEPARTGHLVGAGIGPSNTKENSRLPSRPIYAPRVLPRPTRGSPGRRASSSCGRRDLTRP